MKHFTPLALLFVLALLTLGCGSSEEVDMDAGTGGECGADTSCTPDAPSACGTVCQGICGAGNFDTAGCDPNDNVCFCVCSPGTGVCEASQ